MLSRRHTHQYEQVKLNKIKQSSLFEARNAGNGAGGKEGSHFLNAVRSISDIGKSFSHGRNLHKHGEEEDSPKKFSGVGGGNQLELPKVGSLPKEMLSQKEGRYSCVNIVA